MRKIAVILGALLALAMVGAAFADTSVTLSELNNSGVSGTAQLIAKGDQTEVIITVNGEPADASEPDHIHSGQCGPTLGKIVYPLKNVEGGKSDTTVNASLESLETGGFAINVHESATNMGNFVACGNIPAMASSASATALPMTGGTPIGLIVVVGVALLGTGYVLRRRTA